VLVGKPEKKRLLDKPRYRRKDNKINVMEVVLIGFIWLRTGVVNVITIRLVPYKAAYFLPDFFWRLLKKEDFSIVAASTVVHS
jgi:hypothetical protein